MKAFFSQHPFDDMATYPKSAVLSLDDTALDILLFSVYPEIFDSSYDYADHFKRVASIVGEGYFSWNMRYLEAAFGEKSYSYLFELSIRYTLSTTGPQLSQTAELSTRQFPKRYRVISLTSWRRATRMGVLRPTSLNMGRIPVCRS